MSLGHSFTPLTKEAGSLLSAIVRNQVHYSKTGICCCTRLSVSRGKQIARQARGVVLWKGKDPGIQKLVAGGCPCALEFGHSLTIERSGKSDTYRDTTYFRNN